MQCWVFCAVEQVQQFAVLCIYSAILHTTLCANDDVHQLLLCTTNCRHVFRVGQNCISAPYMTEYLVITLPARNIVYTLYICMVLAGPTRVKSRGIQLCRNKCWI